MVAIYPAIALMVGQAVGLVTGEAESKHAARDPAQPIARVAPAPPLRGVRPRGRAFAHPAGCLSPPV